MKSWSAQWSPAIVMVAVNLALGLATALIKKTLDGGINHMVVATYRLGIATLFLAPIAYFWERKTRPKLTFSILFQLFLSALLGASLTQYFLLLGLAHTSATLSCAFLSMMPAITFIMAVLLKLERLSLRTKPGMAKLLGTLLCIGGAMFLTFYKGLALTKLHAVRKLDQGNHHAKRTENWIIGCVFLFLGTSFFSAWLLVQARINKPYPCQYSSTFLLSLFGSIQSALLSLAKARTTGAWVLNDKRDILTIVYAGVVGQGICTVGMSWCIKKRGPVFTSTFTPLTLIFAAIFDFAILHKEIYLGSILGSAIVIIGLYVFLWGKSKEVKACDCGVTVAPPNAAQEVVVEMKEEDGTNSALEYGAK